MPKTAKKKKTNKDLLKPGLLHLAECLGIILVLTLLSIYLEFMIHTKPPQVLSAKEEIVFESDLNLLEEKKYWEDITRAYPSYRDAYLELADIQEKLGEVDSAIENIKKAKEIDPN